MFISATTNRYFILITLSLVMSFVLLSFYSIISFRNIPLQNFDLFQYQAVSGSFSSCMAIYITVKTICNSFQKDFETFNQFLVYFLSINTLLALFLISKLVLKHIAILSLGRLFFYSNESLGHWFITLLKRDPMIVSSRFGV